MNGSALHPWRWMRAWRTAPRRRPPSGLWPMLLSIGLLVVALVLSPYWTLWRLSRAANSITPQALAPWVNLDLVREEIRRRLNKEANSCIEDISDPFIAWIEQGLRQGGASALNARINLEWIARLLRDPTASRSLIERVHHAFYHLPQGFVIRLSGTPEQAVTLILRPDPLRWRVVAVYY